MFKNTVFMNDSSEDEIIITKPTVKYGFKSHSSDFIFSFDFLRPNMNTSDNDDDIKYRLGEDIEDSDYMSDNDPRNTSNQSVILMKKRKRLSKGNDNRNTLQSRQHQHHHHNIIKKSHHDIIDIECDTTDVMDEEMNQDGQLQSSVMPLNNEVYQSNKNIAQLNMATKKMAIDMKDLIDTVDPVESSDSQNKICQEKDINDNISLSDSESDEHVDVGISLSDCHAETNRQLPSAICTLRDIQSNSTPPIKLLRQQSRLQSLYHLNDHDHDEETATKVADSVIEEIFSTEKKGVPSSEIKFSANGAHALHQTLLDYEYNSWSHLADANLKTSRGREPMSRALSPYTLDQSPTPSAISSPSSSLSSVHFHSDSHHATDIQNGFSSHLFSNGHADRPTDDSTTPSLKEAKNTRQDFNQSVIIGVDAIDEANDDHDSLSDLGGDDSEETLREKRAAVSTSDRENTRTSHLQEDHSHIDVQSINESIIEYPETSVDQTKLATVLSENNPSVSVETVESSLSPINDTREEINSRDKMKRRITLPSQSSFARLTRSKLVDLT
jgi:hypothetical protein